MDPRTPGKKICILGLGISGLESAFFLQSKGFDVFVSEHDDSALIRERAARLADRGISFETGGHTKERVLACEWVLISPGIPPSSAIVVALKNAGVPIYNEIEVASWYLPTGNVIAVTGSSGKTTVATLLHRIFQRAFGRAFLCGNIGNPMIGEISKIKAGDFVIVELSSFQLAYCETFRPATGILLNLTPNHQDWHPDMEDYVASKLRLFMNQKSHDHAVIRKIDRECFFPHYAFHGRVSYFGPGSNGNAGVNPNEEVVRLIAKLYGIDSAIANQVIQEFEGIEHRLEKAAFAGGVNFVNDSKCTTTASLSWALEKFPDNSVILLAGGHPKSNDFETVRTLLSRKVKHAVLIGEAVPLLREAWKDACTSSEFNDFRKAVEYACLLAKPGDTVLLSPACASFDMFRNYQERGTLFKALVRAYAASCVERSDMPQSEPGSRV